MTKREFRDYCKEQLGEYYKDTLQRLGYSKRYLDRYKLDEEIPNKLLEKIGNVEKVEKEETPPQTETQENKKESKNESDGVGIIIPNEAYHNSDKLSASKLKLILENAREYYLRYISKEKEQKDTDALLIGSLHHTLVLEPHRLKEEYVVLNLPQRPIKDDYCGAIEALGGTLNTKQNGKGEIVVSDTVQELKEKLEELKQNSNKKIVTQAQLEMAQTTAEKALNSWFVVEAGMKTLLKAQLKDVLQLDECYVERTFYGTIDGVEIQIRPDILVNLSKSQKVWFVIDLKTAPDATVQTFMSQSAKFYYDVQEYVYREILRQNGIIVKDFRFLVAGKNEGSESAYYQLHTEDIENAEKIVKKIIQKYKYCIETGEWKEGYFDYHNMRFEPNCVVQMPTWRQFELIKMGVM